MKSTKLFADDSIAIFHHFTAQKAPVFKLAAQIYPNGGYCTLRSQPKDVHHVLKRLNVWLLSLDIDNGRKIALLT